MKKLFLLFAVFSTVSLLAESVISVTDKSVSDWDALPSEYVFESTCPEGALWTGVSKIMVYADDEYINYAVFYDSVKMSNHSWTDAMQIFINADNSDQTGGYYELFADAAVDLMLEGNLFDEAGSPIPYSPAVYQWVGPEGGEPSSRVGEWSSEWNLLVFSISGESQIIGNSIIEGRLKKAYIPWSNWSDKFRIGISVQQNWEAIGYLPQGNSPDGERIGRTSQLEVTFAPPTYFKITVQADNTENGSVRGGGEYKKGETAVIMATPRKDCTFAAWSDGNTLNPRSILVTGDAEYTAIFRRNVPLPVVVCSDTMYFTSADTVMLATRVYAPSEIEDYDKIIIATVNNKNVMGFQFVEDAETRNFRTAVEYTKNMNIANVSVVEVVPNGGNYRLRVTDGELAPRCEDCTSATNQLYATQVGADWYFAQYDNSILPEAAAYANRMILYNEEAPRFSSYRQVTGLDRSQTTVFKLHTPRNIPQTPEEIPVDTVSMVEEEKPMEDIPVSIEPQDTVAVISTPYVEYVHSFTLIVWADEAQTQVLVMITYDAQGNQLSITRPSAVRRIPTAGTEISFEVNDLKPNQVYHYTLVACEDDGSILTSLNSSFETATTASGVQNVSGDPAQPLKILLDGQILILRAGTIYTLTGQELK